MECSSKFVVLLDACVLYPAPIRDLLLNLADQELFIPKWTNEIQQEWTRNLLLNRPDLTAARLNRTVDAMNAAFPASNVEGYERLSISVELPDADDRHILAAALECQADVLVTANLKDFPNDYLSTFGLIVEHPDTFTLNLIKKKPKEAIEAFWQQLSVLKNPPLTSSQLLNILSKVGLKATSTKLLALI